MVKSIRAFFFDRDGVLIKGKIKNKKLYAVNKFEDFRFLPGAKEFLRKYKKYFKIIVITNQPDISRGKINKKTIKQMNDKMLNTNLIDDIFICPHLPSHNCNCRKPKLGLIREAQKKYKIDLKKSFLVGDRKSDIDAGVNSGMITIFINRGYEETRPYNQNYTVKSIKNALKLELI